MSIEPVSEHRRGGEEDVMDRGGRVQVQQGAQIMRRPVASGAGGAQASSHLHPHLCICACAQPTCMRTFPSLCSHLSCSSRKTQ